MAGFLTEYALQQILIDSLAGTPSPGIAGVFSGCKMALFKTLIGVNGKTKFADLAEADYNTYARQLAAMSQPYRRATGGVAIASGFLLFQMTDAIKPQTIFLVGLMSAAGNNLLYIESLGVAGVALNDTLDALNVSQEVCLGGVDMGSMSLQH